MEISPGKTSNLHHAPAASTSRPLDGIGLRHLQLARPDRAASNAIRVPRVAVSSSGFLPTPPHGDAVAFDLWLVPSTSTGDSHPRAANHAEHTATPPGGCNRAGAKHSSIQSRYTPTARNTSKPDELGVNALIYTTHPVHGWPDPLDSVAWFGPRVMDRVCERVGGMFPRRRGACRSLRARALISAGVVVVVLNGVV
jgi:hypothetical protein